MPDSPGGPSTATSVLERTETREERSPGDGDRFAHFVRRDRIDAAILNGQPVIALCGKVWVPMRDGTKYPICPRCQALRDQIGNTGKHWPFYDGDSTSTPTGGNRS